MENVEEEKVSQEIKEEKVSQEIKEEKNNTHDKTSATTKALQHLQREEETRRSKCMKSGKTSNKLKKQRMNEKLGKILTPKNARILLNEIKPGFAYFIKEVHNQENTLCTGFTVQIKHGKDILGSGQGLSKSEAKTSAAEDAIKKLFSKAVKSISEENQPQIENEVFPWAGLAQYAMYKMINEWQHQMPDLPQDEIQKFLNFAKTSKSTPTSHPMKKDLPPDAHNLHPTVVLNNLYPNLMCTELERTVGPPSRVKVAFTLDGKQYCGVSSNKKEAKKEAAKVLLTTLYGVKYDSKHEPKKDESAVENQDQSC